MDIWRTITNFFQFHSIHCDNVFGYIEKKGPSFVRPVIDATQRKNILVSVKANAHSSILTTVLADLPVHADIAQQPIAAGKEFLLQCLTPDLGQPRANIWLWFKNGKPIESLPNLISQSPSSYNNRNLSTSNNKQEDELIPNNSDINPIIRLGDELSPTNNADNSKMITKNQQRRRTSTELLSSQQEAGPTNSYTANSLSLLESGRYLFVPSIQLAHKGNYSCVAVNRLGSGLQNHHQQQQAHSLIERDSYQMRISLAPSFVKPLPPKTYWSEEAPLELELVCHVQCDPICQIEWYKNNELLDLKREINNNYLQYQVKQSIMDENLDNNLFKSIESRLVLKFVDISNSKDSHMRMLERRNLLTNTNYTCHSTTNSIGPAIKSTTRFIVQYAPENVIINAPSDKLSLIEGSNGPKLVCGATAEPHVQYRWFLIKGSIFRESKTKNNNNNLKSSVEAIMPIFQSINIGALRKETTTVTTLGQPINQLHNNKALQQQSDKEIGLSFSEGVNDRIAGILDPNNLIELTSSAVEQALVGGSFTSTLDLSNISMDKRQTGHYICQASNKLGQMGQSVYLNIQYKPVCATLHLHSLDIIMAPSTINKQADKNHQEFFQNNQVKPNEATSNDEYSLVRESNEDYIDLRRMLITSPILNYNEVTPSSDVIGQLSFKNSIFQTILNGKKVNKELELFRMGSNDANLKTKDALVNSDDDINHDNDYHSEMNNKSMFDNGGGDSWDRFNNILLKFLNNYVKQVKDFENKFTETTNNIRKMTNNKNNHNRQNRRSQQTSEQNSYNEQDFSTKNLITFACMAQDANPINNLTFDWYFGSINLKENLIEDNNFIQTTTPNFDSLNTSEMPQLKFNENSKPILLYSNENYTLHVVLVRRLDTKSSLNPFQMSLLTLNVILEPNIQQATNEQQQQYLLNRNVRQMDLDSNNNVNKTFKAPVIRNRYLSLYNSINFPKANKNNIQFTQEFYTKSYNGAPITSTLNSVNGFELNEQNWEEQIGNLLKCSVANQIGVSDVCHVRLNIEERLKSKGLSTTHGAGLSTTFEFAKWGVPSLAYKSILSILIFCTIFIIATSALVLGPYIKCGLVMKFMNNNNNNDNGNDESNKADSNTGQSTSSQKSSVLGLLGDNSTQGSSDDDSTARMTNQNHHHHQDQFLANTHKMLTNPNVGSAYSQYNPQMLKESNLSSNYDEPRAGFINTDIDGTGQCYNERTPDIHLSNSSTYRAYSRGLSPNISREIDVDLNKNHNALGSSASRLLANLRIKSLSSKFKVDRISDITNSFKGNLHTKNYSNSGTNTTGLSSNFSSTDNNQTSTATKLISPTSSNNSSTTFFGDTNLRHSYSGFRQPIASLRRQNQNHTNYIYDQNGLQDNSNELRQITKRNSAFLETPTYLNMLSSSINDNPMDRFIQQREIINANESFYRSQSVRNHALSAMSILSNESNSAQQPHHQQQQPHQQELPNLNRGPPVYPRTMYNRPTNNYGRGGPPTAGELTMLNQRPQTTAKARNHLLINNNTKILTDYNNRNRYSINTTPSAAMVQYNQAMNLPTISYNVDTIDSHLNRIIENNAMGYYQNQHYVNNNAISGNYNDTDNLAYNNQTIEHIYDINAYATPEQTPLRKLNQLAGSSCNGDDEITKPRVSQLIQSFNENA